MKHFILMWGLKGCLPDTCQAFKYKKDAIQYTIDVLELPKYGNIIKDLKEFNYVDTNLMDGIEYIEIEICNCKDINVHME